MDRRLELDEKEHTPVLSLLSRGYECLVERKFVRLRSYHLLPMGRPWGLPWDFGETTFLPWDCHGTSMGYVLPWDPHGASMGLTRDFCFWTFLGLVLAREFQVIFALFHWDSHETSTILPLHFHGNPVGLR